MDATGNAVLGIVFLGVGGAATFLMYHLWGYPFDHDAMKSAAPPWLMRLHRVLGMLYGAIYIYFMVQMVPRLWQYQIELPPRTVAHLMLGMTIGAILVVKIMIVRYFKHLEAKLVPALGTCLFIATCLLIGLSAPFAFRQTHLGAGASADTVYSTENRRRVRELLHDVGLEDDALLDRYTTSDSLRAGEIVLTNKCVQCHDLRTALVRPRTATSWRSIVARMADLSKAADVPIRTDEEWTTTAWLIAISPHLQRARREEKKQEATVALSRENLQSVDLKEDAQFDRTRAEALVKTKCTQCHGLEEIENSPPRSLADAKVLVSRMIDEGFTAPDDEIRLIVQFLADK